MIRLAQLPDTTRLTQMMLHLRQHTTWGSYQRDGYNTDTVTGFITHKLLDPRSVVYVSDGSADGVVAFCGVTLVTSNLPPHILCIHEWGWGGEKREAVRCWQAVKKWGKKKGAELAYRVLGKPTRSTTKFREVATWEVL